MCFAHILYIRVHALFRFIAVFVIDFFQSVHAAAHNYFLSNGFVAAADANRNNYCCYDAANNNCLNSCDSLVIWARVKLGYLKAREGGAAAFGRTLILIINENSCLASFILRALSILRRELLLWAVIKRILVWLVLAALEADKTRLLCNWTFSSACIC